MTDVQETLAGRVAFLVPLNKLSSERQTRLLESSEVIKLRKKKTLFEQGDRDDFTYYVLEGEIEMYADDSLIKAVAGGDGASFQPLAQLQPRQMTAIAKKTAQVLRVNRSLLEQLLSVDEAPAAKDNDSGVEVEEFESDQSGDWLMTLLQSELFTRIPPSNIPGLLDTLETINVASGDAVVTQGEPGDFYYAVQSGRCEVVRTGPNDREIKLAELSAGDTFGEEALISGGKRNATVRMTTAGELARLTKEDFTQLIKAPMVSSVKLAEAKDKVAEGALWLDVRFEDEHGHNGIPDSQNIPLSSLRARMGELDPAIEFIAYCDTGGRSSAAAFLLAGKGLNASYVEGGAVSEPIPEKPPVAPREEPAPNDALEASALASSLSAELEIARLTIEKAEKMMAQAEAMKRDADRIVSEKLATERAQIDAESAKLKSKLGEAQQLRESLTAKQKIAEDEAARCQDEVEQRSRKLEEAAHQRLREEEQRLEALYKDQAAQLESLQSERESDLHETLNEKMRAERLRIESELATRESELRESMAGELASERKKFEQEFLRTNEELEKAHEERLLAVAGKEAATVEAQTTIAEFKSQQQKLMAEQQLLFDKERQRLQAEALRISKLRDEATKERESAEAAKARAEEELVRARAQHAERAQLNEPAAIDEIELRANAATENLEQAIQAESVADSAARDNEDELERTYSTANEINVLLEKELDDWVGEQNDLQESTIQREVLSRQKEMVERIRARAAEMKSKTEADNKSLLEEIEDQLGKD
jgi:CRP-like cAMP-binding protein